MKLINTDGMALLGPGSEWLWTALTGVVLAVTFLAIYRQLAIARSASAREQRGAFLREWHSERMQRHKLAVLVAIREGAASAHLPEGSVDALASFWNSLGQLARSGDVDRKVLVEGYGPVCQGWWATLAPQIRRWRDEGGSARILEDFEWLASRASEMDRGAGRPEFDERVLGSLAERITSLEGSLRVEEALRTVIVAPPDARTVAPPAPAAPASPASI